MSTPPSRRIVTFALIVGAVVFGMVLAGGLDLTPAAVSGPAETAGSGVAVKVQAQGLPGFADLAEAVDPAIVSIEARTVERRSSSGRVDPFEFFFGPRRRPAPEEQEEFVRPSGGSGFVISADGLVVTNNHVVAEADEVRVRLNGREYAAELKGVDPATDIALLKVEAGSGLTHLRLGDSEELRVGDWVMAVGSPLNLEKTVTVGVVSAKGRALGIGDTSFENFIQTDAAINFGNSGGPLINLAGEVVGINTAINYGAENIGFAVPVNILKQILPQLRDEGRVRRGYLGIEITNLDYESSRAFGLESTDGALVSRVTPDTPADKAGLKHGDIILEVDGREVAETRDLIDYVSAQGPDAKVNLQILRDGKRMRKEVQLAERPDLTGSARPVPDEPDSGIDWLGVQYQTVTPELREMHELPADVEGIWLTQVAPTSPLYEEQVRRGDIITEVNGQSVANAREFDALVSGAESGSFLRFYVLRLVRSGETRPFFAFVQVP